MSKFEFSSAFVPCTNFFLLEQFTYYIQFYCIFFSFIHLLGIKKK